MDRFYGDGDESLQPTDYEFEPLREDEDFTLYRGRHLNHADTSSAFLMAPALTRPVLETFKKIEHEYSFRSALDAGWPVRPLALSRYDNWFQLPIARQAF